MGSFHRHRAFLAVLFLVSTPFMAFAQSEETYELTAEEMVEFERLDAIFSSLDRRTGEIQLDGGVARIDVPENFYFLGPDDAESVLVDIWGNPPGQNVLGMLFPSDYNAEEFASWAVIINFVDDGYVSDEDAADIDYDELLEQMQDETEDANPDRVAAGYGEVELLGWADPPYYDASTKKLYWAKELRFDGSDETTLNYEIRILGRHGILTMTFIAVSEQLSEIKDSRESVLAMAEFGEGDRYFDFNPSTDKVAAYGIGALVAGKLAAKAGLFAGGLILLKKFGIFLLIGIAALGRKFKSVFASKKSEQ